ncbi:hypothetical protein HPB52_007727 [Rhipicephalus sanguineus]|uniref:Uncharacterized protein n=1 Tax=Rhipicephalus sanguineus TaxID=34632 RepID=A0A9D4PRY1_RHISA|nr:hypothetical protein HPB52_007727 [Rhipicephalus sanguineus]
MRDMHGRRRRKGSVAAAAGAALGGADVRDIDRNGRVVVVVCRGGGGGPERSPRGCCTARALQGPDRSAALQELPRLRVFSREVLTL